MAAKKLSPNLFLRTFVFIAHYAVTYAAMMMRRARKTKLNQSKAQAYSTSFKESNFMEGIYYKWLLKIMTQRHPISQTKSPKEISKKKPGWIGIIATHNK